MSSEIELAIKLGRCILNPEHYESKVLKKTLDELGINIYNNDRINKHLQAFCEHRGDVSLIQYVADFADGNYFTDKLQCRNLAYFITGLNLLYPMGSMEYILQEWHNYLGEDFITSEWFSIYKIHDWAKQLYAENKNN
jgi:hypothetical protein